MLSYAIQYDCMNLIRLHGKYCIVHTYKTLDIIKETPPVPKKKKIREEQHVYCTLFGSLLKCPTYFFAIADLN